MARRLALFAALAEAEVHLLLVAEPVGTTLQPRVFPLAEGPVVLGFDGPEALAAFAGPGAAYAALPGRVLVPMLAGRGLGLMLQAPGGLAELMAPGSLDWLAHRLDRPAPQLVRGVAQSYGPASLPPPLVAALERRLAAAPGLTGAALASVRWQDGRAGHVLALAGIPPAAEAALARALAEALAFAGAEDTALDIAFAGPAAVAGIAAAGTALALPAPRDPAPAPTAPATIGRMRPPRLR